MGKSFALLVLGAIILAGGSPPEATGQRLKLLVEQL